MTTIDSEAAVRALLTEPPPAAEVTRQGRERLLALATATATPAAPATAATLPTPVTPASPVTPAAPRRRRRVLTVGLSLTAAAAAVTAIALVAASSGTGAGPVQHGTAHGAPATAPTAPSVKARLLAAIGAAAGQLLSVHSTETVAGQTFTENIWLAPWGAQAGQTQRMRLESPGDQDVEMIYTMPAGSTGGTLTSRGKGQVEGQLIDVETRARTWSDQARTPIATGSPVESPAQLRREIASGQFKVVARTDLAGQPVLQLRHTFPSPPGSGPWTRDLWVSARTFLPVRAVSRFTEGSRAKGWQSDVITVSYQFRPATAANLAELRPVIPAGFTRTATPPVNRHG